MKYDARQLPTQEQALLRRLADLVAPISVSVIGGMEIPSLRTITLTLIAPTGLVIAKQRGHVFRAHAEPQQNNQSQYQKRTPATSRCSFVSTPLDVVKQFWTAP